MVSAIYLVLHDRLVCIVGPFFTGHDFTTIYQDYVRVPPSLAPYPQAEMIEEARSSDAVRARARRRSSEWQQDDGRIIVDASPRPSRSTSASPAISTVPSTFEDARVEEDRPDGRRARHECRRSSSTISCSAPTMIGRDLLTRTLIAGRVSLAIGLLRRHRRGASSA